MALIIKTQNSKASENCLWIGIDLPNGDTIRVSAKVGNTGSNKGSALVMIDADKDLYNVRRLEQTKIPTHDKNYYRAKRENQARLVNSLDD